MSSITAITIRELIPAIRENIRINVPTGIFSGPGIGKSTIASQIAALEAKRFPGGFLAFSTTETTALDLGGLWQVRGEGMAARTYRCPSDFIDFDKPQFILIDELGDCPAHEQSGFYQMVNDRKIGGRALHPKTYILFATNRPEDGCAANELSFALKTRAVLFTLRADKDSLLDYALAPNPARGFPTGWDSRLTAFIRSQGHDFVDNGFDVNCPYGGAVPRKYEFLARLLAAGGLSSTNPKVREAQLCGFLGPKAGRAFMAFLDISIPDPELVYVDPTTAPIPSDLAEQICYHSAVAANCRDDMARMDKATTYAVRCDKVTGGKSAGCNLLQDILLRYPNYKKCPAFAKNSANYLELFVS